MKTKKGASIVEAVLIMTILFGLVQLVKQIDIEGLRPVNFLQSMVRYGVWNSTDGHANSYYRALTTEGCMLDSSPGC